MKHILELRFNLLSIGKLDNEGYDNSFSANEWKLKKGSMVIAKGKRNSNLYIVQLGVSKCCINTCDNDSSSELWRKRLSHMSEKGLSILAKKNVLYGVSDAKMRKCSHHLVSKQRRFLYVIRTKEEIRSVGFRTFRWMWSGEDTITWLCILLCYFHWWLFLEKLKC